jgi:superfamily II DNA or RNA helicase
LDDLQVSHLRAYAHGGPLILDNLAAWCAPCNLQVGATDVGDGRLEPRAWQQEALKPIVAQIVASRAATLSAAPGAGKTVFAGLVFEHLRALDVVDRMVVLAPRRTLVDQWVAALARHRHLQLKPFSTCERRHVQQVGVVVTYQSLNLETTAEHREQAARSRTLLVLDEVHHVGEPGGQGHIPPAWARYVTEFAGTVDQDLHVAAVLNLSGTLWRTDPSERISTVRYKTLPTGRLESIVDYDVGAPYLIGERQLRPVDLFRQGARVEVADLRQLEIIESHMADLDARPARAVVAKLGSDAAFRRSFVRAVLERLEVAHRSLDRAPVKALIVCARQDHARAMQDTADMLMRQRGLRPITALAVSDEREAAETLERFRRERQVGVLCTVDMAGEGYDCPEIVVVGFASNKLTPLYIRQVVARAQRVTDREWTRGRPIPATIVVPDIAEVVDQVSQVILPMRHEVVARDRDDTRDRDRESDPDRDCDRDSEPRYEEYQLRAVHPDDDLHARVVGEQDGDVDGEAVRRLEPILAGLHVEPSYAARVIVAARHVAAQREAAQPFDRARGSDAAIDALADGSRPVSRSDTEAVARRRASREDEATSWQRDLHGLSRWWALHGDVPVAEFTALVNAAGDIPPGGRGLASPEQLQAAYDYAAQRILAYAQRRALKPPAIRRDWRDAQPGG